MSNITQDSLDIRLQKLICCIGTLGGEIQGMIAVGNDCYKEKLQKLKILVGYLEALECYSIDDTSVNSTGTLEITKSSAGLSIEVFVNNISISGIYNTTSTNVVVQAALLTAAINAYQSTYVAVHTIGTGIITITGNCSNEPLTVTADVGLDITVSGLTGGTCSTNCLTEEQVLVMFDRVSQYCDICFPSTEYNFNNSLTT